MGKITAIVAGGAGFIGSHLCLRLLESGRRVDEINSNLIYAQMNYMAVDLAYHVFKRRKNVPFVWHFKEGSFSCPALNGSSGKSFLFITT